MTVAALEFDPAEHRYTVNGLEVPSVTTILKDAGMVDYSFCQEFARERGSAAHSAIHFALEGDLDESSLHPMLVGYVAAARQAVADMKLEIVAVERRVFSRSGHFAGTLDLGARLQKKLAFFDWKTGDPPPATALQLAAYADAWYEETGELVSHRYAIRLFHDGRYVVIPYTDRHDIVRFRAAVTVAAWRKEKGLL